MGHIDFCEHIGSGGGNDLIFQIHGIQNTSQSSGIAYFHTDALAASGVQFLCTQFLHHASVVNDTVMGSQTGKLVQNVTGNQNSDLSFTVQFQNQLTHFHDALGVKTVYRFVQNKEVGITG